MRATDFEIAAVESEAEGSADVVELLAEPEDVPALITVERHGAALFGKPGEVREMAALDVLKAATLAEFLQGELADHVEHGEARLSIDREPAQQAVGHERADAVQRVRFGIVEHGLGIV